MPLIIVPASHISEESIKNARKAIESFRPDIVAVELDMDRFLLMESEEKTPLILMLKSIGPINLLMFWLMKKLQYWLGKKTGILPGSEMLAAVNLAERMGIDVAFIDREISVTFAKLSALPAGEKLKLLIFLLKGLFLSLLPGKLVPGKKIDLSRLPPEKLIDEALEAMKRELPGLHRVLVSERDAYMARELATLLRGHSTVVAVIGAGHAKGLVRILKRTYNLSDADIRVHAPAF